MLIRTGFKITVECATEAPMILALQSHAQEHGRMIGSDEVHTDPALKLARFVDGFGNRRTRLTAPKGVLTLSSDCVFQDDGRPDDLNPTARQHPIAELPHEVLPYLTASRYCESDCLTAPAWQLFGDTPEGWERVQAITDFVHESVTFGYEFAQLNKTALDVMREGRGVCRDFAHLAIALCRAMNIPARYVSGYLGDIGVPPAGPGDFCAWFEVYLGGRWYTFDARYNVPRIGRIVMVRGRDAADVPMIMSFGNYELRHFEVWTDEVMTGPYAQVHAGETPGIADPALISVRMEAAE